MDFDFITDEKFKTILIRDFEELNKCINIKASKAVLILSGSIIESVLSDYFTNFPPNDESFNPKNTLSLELSKLIDLALECKLISPSTKDLSTIVRNYRNLIHPGREIRKNETFDFDSALVAKNLLNIILKEVRENYIKNVGRKAKDVLNKLENDAISQPVFEKIVAKLHKSEKVKLYNLIVEYDLDRERHFQGPIILETKKYIQVLKSHVDREVIVSQLLKLVDKIECGEKWEVITYYNILFDDLSYIDDGSIETILLYVMNVLEESTMDEEELSSYVQKRMFSTFGNHLINEVIEKAFLDLCCAIVNNSYLGKYRYFAAYKQLVNSVDHDKNILVKDYVTKSIGKYFSEDFYKEYNDGDYIQF